MKTFGIILSLADPYIHGKLQQQPQTWLEMVRNLNKLAVYTFFWVKQATGHYFAGASLVPPGFITAQDDCDNGWSQTFLQCRHIPVEIGLGYARLMGSKPLTTAVMVGMSTEPHRTWNTAGQIAVLREAVWRWMLGEGEVNVTICQSAPHHRKSYRRKGESPPARSGWPRGGCDCSFTSPPRLQKSRRDQRRRLDLAVNSAFC